MEKPFAVVPLDLGTITTGNARANRPAAHLAEFGSTGMVWQSAGAADLWVRGDFGAAQAVNFMSLIWANAGPDTTIRLRLGADQAAVDGEEAPYDSGPLPFIDPAITRDDGHYSSHLELDAVETWRWWRIDIDGHAGDFAAAALILGRKIESASFSNPGWQFGVEDLGSLDISRWGVPNENPGKILRSLSFKIGWVLPEDWETKWRPLMERGARRVSFWCFDPEATPYRQARSYLGYLQPQDVAGGVVVTRYEMEVQVRSVI